MSYLDSRWAVYFSLEGTDDDACIYDCEYCVNRKSHDILRLFLSPEEIATLTIEFLSAELYRGAVLIFRDYPLARLYDRTAH